MLEKHGANLPRRVDVERHAGQRVDLFLQAAERCVQCVGRLAERLRVECDAGLFHLCKDGHEGHLNVVKEPIGSVFHEQWAEMFHQLPRYVRIFGRVLTNVLHRDFTHRALPLTARPDERLDGDGAVAEVGFGEVIHVVGQLGVEQVMSDHRVEEWAVDTDAVFDQHHEVELDVLPHLLDRGVLKRRGEGSDRGARLLFVGWHGHIPRFVGTDSERHAD